MPDTGIDLHTIDGQRPSPETIANWAASGSVSFAVIGLHSPEVAAAVARDFVRAGISDVAWYIWLNYERDVLSQVAPRLGPVFEFGKTLWVDIEPGSWQSPDPEHYRAWAEEAVARIADFVPSVQVGVYTARWVWEAAGSPTIWFTEYPRWDARYDGVPDFSGYDRGEYLYGGMAADQVVMKQYAGTTSLLGYDVDLNVRRSRTMADQRTEDLAGQLVELANGIARNHDVNRFVATLQAIRAGMILPELVARLASAAAAQSR